MLGRVGSVAGDARAQSMLEASASTASKLPAGDGEAVSSGQRHGAGRPSATVVEVVAT
jgi:hypothetical protein